MHTLCGNYRRKVCLWNSTSCLYCWWHLNHRLLHLLSEQTETGYVPRLPAVWEKSLEKDFKLYVSAQVSYLQRRKKKSYSLPLYTRSAVNASLYNHNGLLSGSGKESGWGWGRKVLIETSLAFYSLPLKVEMGWANKIKEKEHFDALLAGWINSVKGGNEAEDLQSCGKNWRFFFFLMIELVLPSRKGCLPRKGKCWGYKDLWTIPINE